MNAIDIARDYESSIKIIDEVTVGQGLYFLNHEVVRYLSRGAIPAVGMPIKRGGVATWLEATRSTDMPVAPIRMSHTGPNNSYLPEAVCTENPDLESIYLGYDHTARIFVFDGIMETVGTLKGLVKQVNGMVIEHNEKFNTNYPFPFYQFFVLVDKAIGNAGIANLHAAFKADNRIWYHGVGADDKSETGDERGRDKKEIWGRLPNNFTGALPEPPFYKQNF